MTPLFPESKMSEHNSEKTELERILDQVEARDVPVIENELKNKENMADFRELNSNIIKKVLFEASDKEKIFHRLTGFSQDEFEQIAAALLQDQKKIHANAKVCNWKDRLFLLLIFLHTGSPSTLGIITKPFVKGLNTVYEVLKTTLVA